MMTCPPATIQTPRAVLTVRRAVDSRPPAEPWSTRPAADVVSVDQPALQLVERTEPQLRIDAPQPTRTPVSVDVVPAGVDPQQGVELAEQARLWAPWFAQLLAEALDGRRPLESMSRWLDDWVLAEVSRRVRLLRRTRQHAARIPPASIVSLRTQLTHPRVLEVAVHLHRGQRSAAWAFQLVRVGERWRCTALVVDPLPDQLGPRSAVSR